jgi:hypothetical protein
MYSWGSLVFTLDGERYYGFTAVAFGEKREYTKAYSMARHHAPIGRPSGKYTAENVKVTGWKHSVLALKAALAAKSANQLAYGNVEFQGLLQYIEADQTEITINFDRLKWTANTVSHEEAPDSLKSEFELDCMMLRENGMTLFDSTEGLP